MGRSEEGARAIDVLGEVGEVSCVHARVLVVPEVVGMAVSLRSSASG